MEEENILAPTARQATRSKGKRGTPTTQRPGHTNSSRGSHARNATGARGAKGMQPPAEAGGDVALRWAAEVLGELRGRGGPAELARAVRRLQDPPRGARAGDFLPALLGPPDLRVRERGTGAGPMELHPRGLLGTTPPDIQARSIALLRIGAPLLPRSDLERALSGLARQAATAGPRALAADALAEVQGTPPAGVASGPGAELPDGLRKYLQSDIVSLPTLPWAHSARLSDLLPPPATAAADEHKGSRGTQPPTSRPSEAASAEASPARDALESLELALQTHGPDGRRANDTALVAALELAAAELQASDSFQAPPRPLLEALAMAAGTAPEACVRCVLKPMLARGGAGRAECELARALARGAQGAAVEPQSKRHRGTETTDDGNRGAGLNLVLQAVAESPGWPGGGRLALTGELVTAAAAAGGGDLSSATLNALAVAVERACLTSEGARSAPLVKLVAHLADKLGARLRPHRGQFEAAVASTSTFLTDATLQKLQAL